MKTRRLIATLLSGNILEWYDFAVYGVFAKLLAQLFFPTESAQTALLSTFAIFAVGYFMRPLGGLLHGHLGDTRSRKLPLIITILMMGSATTLIGFLPTYETIGLWAPIALVVLRLIQGLAVGGEYPGSMVMLYESSKNYKAFTTILSVVGASVGFLLGVGVAGMFHQQWRVPFLLGILLAGIGLYLRLKLASPKVKRVPGFPVADLLKSHKFAFSSAFFTNAFTAVFSGFMIYLPTYLTQTMKLSSLNAIGILFFTMVVMIIMLILGAYLCDKLRVYHTWFLIGLIATAAITYPLFMGLYYHSINVYLFLFILMTVFSLTSGPIIYLITQRFPENLRYSGTALSHSLAYSIIAGTTPLVLTHFIPMYGYATPAYYLIIFTVLAGIGEVGYLFYSY